ncbi:MAG: NAD(P)/FAD-dependent oxidoreductase [Actinomycetota bacterium]|nr:NAD(P)/FAD-dependent oxidoreductase [Actinomycetota bacterium]
MSRSTLRMVGTVVIGAGQAGLAAGYHLAHRGQDFVILDAADAVGATWRRQWDSLRLFTPAGFTSLPSLPFPADPREHPGKDAVADYLVAYAEHFRLPVVLRARVEAVFRAGTEFQVVTERGSWRTPDVILATGAHDTPAVPGFAGRLNAGIVQLHTRDYRRPDQLPPGPVLVVGAGNSGAEIALELATDSTAERSVHLAGRDVGHIPDLGPRTFPLLQRLGRVGAVLAQKGLRGGGDPLGRIRPSQLEAAGVLRQPRVTGVRDGRPLLADDRTLAVASVVWCTGFRPHYGWLQLDVLDTTGRLRHRGGIVHGEPGLYAVGLPYQRSVTSHLVGGVGADARYVVDHLVAHRSADAA